MNWLTDQLLHNRGLGDNAVEKNAIDTLKNGHNNSNIEEKTNDEPMIIERHTYSPNQNNAHNLHRHKKNQFNFTAPLKHEIWKFLTLFYDQVNKMCMHTASMLVAEVDAYIWLRCYCRLCESERKTEPGDCYKICLKLHANIPSTNCNCSLFFCDCAEIGWNCNKPFHHSAYTHTLFLLLFFVRIYSFRLRSNKFYNHFWTRAFLNLKFIVLCCCYSVRVRIMLACLLVKVWSPTTVK